MAGLDPDFTLYLDSANDLKKVNVFTNMNVYALAWVAGDPRHGINKKKTPVVKDGGTNPIWESHPINFPVSEKPLLHNQLTLNIELVSDRLLRDTKIGKAEIPLKELLDSMGGGDALKKQINQVRLVRYPVQPQGTINFRYIFNSHEPVMVYPVGHPGSSSGYPPASHAGAYPPAQAYPYPPPGAYAPPPHQQPGYAHAPPPQVGYAYGYPPHAYPPQPGHGYQVQQYLQGGLLIAGMSNDVVQMAAAYDAGGDDAGFGGETNF